MNLTWIKCSNNSWCPFLILDLRAEYFNTSRKGVYIIWQPSTGRVIRVGQGVIKDRIAEHRENNKITQYSNLSVTWAEVSSVYMDGVENYLATQLKPLIGDRFPEVSPIQVNIP